MEENPSDIPAHPGVPLEAYHTLGKKTLMIFVLQRVQASLVLLLISAILFAVQGQTFVLQIPIPDLNKYIALAAWALFGLFVIFFLLSFLIAWIIYINYKFFLGENSLKIKRGVFNKEEIAIPYRQIQDVNIDRNISFRLMGVSRLLVLTAGEEDIKPQQGESETEGVLPALDCDLAEWLQAELLRRANIQKVVEVPEVAPK